MSALRFLYFASGALFVLILAGAPLRSQTDGDQEPGPGREVAIDLRFETRGTGERAQLPEIVQVLATPYDRPAVPGRTDRIRVELSRDEPGSMSLRRGRWRIEAVVEGWWCEPAELDLGEGSNREISLGLWPAGKVSARIRPAKGEPIPDTVATAFRPALGESLERTPPKATVRCPVDDDGRFVCSLPAGRWDLRFQVLPYVPRFQWGAVIAAGKVLTLGSTRLIRGAAVMGWVVTESGASAAGARVALRVQAKDLPSPELRAQVRSRSLKAEVNDRGFFEIAGVSPGAYILETALDGFATTHVPVKLQTGAYLELRDPPILLIAPLSFDVFVTPPVGPGSVPWRLTLFRSSGPQSARAVRVVEVTLDEAGSANVEGLEPGSYFAELRSDGNTWWHEAFELREDQGPLIVDLPLIEVEGTAHLGDEPLSATLHFGGLFGTPKVVMTSDEDGNFNGTLPNPGEWKVGVESEDPAIRQELADIDVKRPKGGQPARVRIELDDTEISGRVIDEAGITVSRAIVSLEDATRGATQVFTDTEGSFSLRGLPTGSVEIQAKKKGVGSSDVAIVALAAGTGSKTDLVLRPAKRIVGRVVSEAGAVPGARIVAAPLGATYLSLRTTSTDATGGFTLEIPESATAVALQVEPPGFAMRLMYIPFDGSDLVPIGVRQDGGTLNVERGESTANDDTFPVIVHGGFVAPLGRLARWIAAGGETYTANAEHAIVRNLAPGTYEVCSMTERELRQIEVGTAVLNRGRCVSGVLAAGGNVTLESR